MDKIEHRPPVVAVAVMIAALLVIAILDFGPLIGIGADADAILTLLAALIFVFVHGCIALGPRHMIAFSLITVVISFSSEAVGVATGLVFGAYHYTDQLGPKIIGVPPMMQIGYLATGYASVMMGRIILSLLRPVTGWAILAASLAGAFIMVSWDVAMDPHQSTVTGDWIWHDGGVYFGVPLHNYAGWFGHRLHLHARLFPIRQPLCRAGIIIVPLVGGISLPYASPANYDGRPQALEASLSLVAIFVMGSPVVFALCRLLLDRSMTVVLGHALARTRNPGAPGVRPQ
jgi:putative membrane protein